MSKPLIFRLLLTLAFAFAGGFAQLHALSHAQHDLAAAVAGDKAPAPLTHATDHCLVVHALDGAASEAAPRFAIEPLSQSVEIFSAGRSPAAPALAFRSRAPPLLS